MLITYNNKTIFLQIYTQTKTTLYKQGESGEFSKNQDFLKISNYLILFNLVGKPAYTYYISYTKNNSPSQCIPGERKSAP